MKVFVTGATGYIGTAVCEALKNAGHQVTGLARSPERAQLLESRGYLARLGDLADLDTLKAAAGTADSVVHLAMKFGSSAGQIDRAAISAMIEAGKPVLYTSGVWVYGDTDGRMLGELAPLNPPPLVAWRPAVEQLVLDAGGMVLRPGMVYGRKGGAPAGFFDTARQYGEVRIVGDGHNHWSNVHIDDLADLYLRAVNEPHPGQLFLACGGMPQPVKKIAGAVATACGIEGKVVSISVAEARQTLGPVADCLVMDVKVASTKAARFFGWTVRKPSIFDEIASGSYLA